MYKYPDLHVSIIDISLTLITFSLCCQIVLPCITLFPPLSTYSVSRVMNEKKNQYMVFLLDDVPTSSFLCMGNPRHRTLQMYM